MAIFENLVATAESQSIRWGVQINMGKGENQNLAGGLPGGKVGRMYCSTVGDRWERQAGEGKAGRE
jgi:hypothetical protein